MTSGNHMVDGADRILDAQDWQCPACGSRRDPEDTGYCGNFCEECTEPCPDRIKQYRDEEMNFFTHLLAAIEKFMGIDPYYGIELQCPEYNDALRCENCGHVEKL